MQRKYRETSKMLVWTIIFLSFFLSAGTLVLGYLTENFTIAAPAAAGQWVAMVSAFWCYANKAKAENTIKLQESSPALKQMQDKLVVALADNEDLLAALSVARGEIAMLRQHGDMT